MSEALVFSFVVKFSVFALGVAIIGIFATRTGLPGCSSSGTIVPVYSAPFGDVEAYTDYRDLYLRCLVTPFVNGSGAYSLPIVNNYPPLFLYTLSAFAQVNLVWFPAIPLLLLDALTVIPVYKIAREFLFDGNGRHPFMVSLLWVANPLTLFYNDLMWLNTAATTFFLVLTVYFFLRQNWIVCALCLALSTGYKQVSVVVFPVLLILMAKTRGLTRGLFVYAGVYVASVLLISTPYLFQNPQLYLWALSFPILGTPPGYSSGNPTTFSYNLSQPTRLTTFFGLVRSYDLQSFAVASYTYLDYVFALAYFALMAYLLIAKRRFDAKDVLLLVMASLSIFFTFFGRGVYKYYFASLTPLALPFYLTWRNTILFEAFSVAILLAPREVTPWMALLLLTLLPGLFSSRKAPEAKVVSSGNT